MKTRKLVYEPLSDEWIHGKDIQPEERSIVDVWVPAVDPDTGYISGHIFFNCWIFAGEVLSGSPPQVIRGSVFWRPAAEQKEPWKINLTRSRMGKKFGNTD